MFAANPKTRYIGAHFAYYGHDLKTAAALLDRLPNVVLEVSAVLYEFGRAAPARRASSSSNTRPHPLRQGLVPAERIPPTTGACSKRQTSSSTITATITRSGSSTA